MAGWHNACEATSLAPLAVPLQPLHGWHVQPNNSSIQCLASQSWLYYEVLAQIMAHWPQCHA